LPRPVRKGKFGVAKEKTPERKKRRREPSSDGKCWPLSWWGKGGIGVLKEVHERERKTNKGSMDAGGEVVFQVVKKGVLQERQRQERDDR